VVFLKKPTSARINPTCVPRVWSKAWAKLVDSLQTPLRVPVSPQEWGYPTTMPP
jgi:hypothetical protein